MRTFYLICNNCGRDQGSPFDEGDACPTCDDGKLVDNMKAYEDFNRRESMEKYLICSYCLKEEGAPFNMDDTCPSGCGGKLIKKRFWGKKKTLTEVDDNYIYPAMEEDPAEKCPAGKGQHEPGAKCDDGKVKAGVLEDFSLALWEVARVGSNGADKYTRHGWESVPNGIERYNDAKWRHMLKGVREPLDPEWDILHLAHEAWGALAKLELILREGK